MERKTINIDIPNNLEIDWDESKKQNKLVLKDKQLSYEEVCKKLFWGGSYFTGAGGGINKNCIAVCAMTDPNNATTEHQLKCILAKNKLANVAIFLNDGWKPSKDDAGYVLNIIAGALMPIKVALGHHDGNVFFKTNELAHQAIEILGEETIKLALEPLGI